MREDKRMIILPLLCIFLLAYLPLQFLVATPSSPSSTCHPHQRDALLRFINSFSIAPPPPIDYYDFCTNASYPKTASWREDQDCCSWEGVSCDNSTSDVVGLDLACSRLLGHINSSSPLFSLRHLRSLSLARNDLLSSTIPPEISVFTRLAYLNLSSSSISGIIPTELSRLPRLISLDLSDNFGLEMEDHTMRMLVGNLTELEELHLSDVNMSKVTPIYLRNITSSLISLVIDVCSLGGEFPEYIFGLPSIQKIDLSGNYDLTGTLPEYKWSPSLDFVSLGGCSFTGAVPNSIGNLSRLTYLNLSDNNFTGEFDLGMLSTLRNLQFLRLSGLSVSGEYANLGFSFPKLQELYMGNSNLSKFPSFLSRSKELRLLGLGGNNIQEIPSWLWSIRIDTLEELYLSNNLLRGSIPLVMCQLTSLSRLNLNGNKLTGVIPQCLGNLTDFEMLFLSNNSLSGPLPPSLANCTSLQFLDVSYNNFVGQWPTDIFLRSASLYYIDLSDNKFEGPLPLPSYATQSYLVSNNNFSGNISSIICNATNLLLLDLSNNGLTGTLPHCLSDIIISLPYLNLRANAFRGIIPEIFNEGSILVSLDLSRNQFEGLLPRSLSSCKRLEALDVGNNKLVDSFPSWLGDLPLKVLSLRSNNFHGHIISEETHNFSQVRILDLSNNNFESNISDKFISGMIGMTRDYGYGFPNQYMGLNNGISTYYTVMVDLKGIEMEMVKINVQFTMLDLSNNRLRGEIPRSIGVLKSLMGLNFSRNGFTGKIPPSTGDLTNLESMDLSSNHLMGEIPNELVKLTFLEFLNLSGNNLTGPIPHGGHFDTFPDSSFEGNPGLCGIPLTRSCGQGHKEAQPPFVGKDDGKEEGRGWLEWKYVAMGFGSGMGIGISLGYMVLEIGRPLWLVRMVVRLEASCRKRSKKNVTPRWDGRR